jgi:riboflavin kinase/FMN adenylyltransferase
VSATLCLGKFDALHLGHRALAERAVAVGGAACLLSFTGMAEVLGWPARQPLVAPSERGSVLGRWSGELRGAVSQASLPFAEVRPLSAAEFLALARARFGAAALVVGEDFRGGRGREAGVAELRPLAAAAGLRLEVVPHVAAGGAPVSSSRVREALARGDVAEAALCLGRPHRVVGTVERGDGRGRAIGVPTANCGARENQEPAPGVYAALAEVGGRLWPAAVNVGRNPTVAPDRPLTVEAHLLGFSGDCYGARLALDFRARLRDERRFPSLDALKAQLAGDLAAAAGIVGAPR